MRQIPYVIEHIPNVDNFFMLGRGHNLAPSPVDMVCYDLVRFVVKSERDSIAVLMCVCVVGGGGGGGWHQSWGGGVWSWGEYTMWPPETGLG